MFPISPLSAAVSQLLGAAGIEAAQRITFYISNREAIQNGQRGQAGEHPGQQAGIGQSPINAETKKLPEEAPCGLDMVLGSALA
jgi:hypothetical protein